jgi:hypothetical protein
VSRAGIIVARMHGLRLVLILALVALMDLGCPLLPEAPEEFDEFDEAAYGRRRVPEAVDDASPGSPLPAAARVSVAAPHPVRRPRPVRAVAVPIRKLPPPGSDPVSALDDH